MPEPREVFVGRQQEASPVRNALTAAWLHDTTITRRILLR
jgi:hypothetical protein